MVDTDKIIISNLDFDQIKAQLRQYLQSQDEFSDYDFDGAGLSVLLDVLAYNTYYGAYYDNVVANESRLHSAITRNSIVSKAKELGYVPYSRTAPFVLLDLVMTPPNPNDTYWQNLYSVEVPAGKVFSTTVDGKNFDYTTLETFYLIKSGDSYVTPVVNGEPQYVKAYEGKLKFASFIVDNQDLDSRYKIPSAGVDKSKLRVYVKPNVSSGIETQVEYYHANTFPIPNSENNAYWIWENDDFQYEIEFGDGVLGKKLKDGNVIVVEYLVTNGSLTNGCTGFRLTSGIAGVRGVKVTTIGKSSGGSEEESLESIKFSAPKSYSMQGRAVTVDDYKFLIKQLYPSLKSINVWGGEDNLPPQYGKVLVSVIPAEEYTDEQLSVLLDEICASLEPYNMISIQPEGVLPDFIYLVANSNVIFDKTKTILSDADIRSAVEATIVNFSDDVIERFNSNFRYSQLVGEIDNTDPSIISNLTTISLQRRFVPNTDILIPYQLNFRDSIEPESVYMSGFTYYEPTVYADTTYKVVDDGAGKLNVVRVRPNKTDIILSECGNVDYGTGLVNLTNFIPLSYVGDYMSMNVKPVDPDVVTSQNTVLTISNYTVTVSQGKS